MQVGALRAVLQLDDSDFQRGVDQSERRFSGASRTIARTAAVAAGAVVGVGGAMLGAASAAASHGDAVAKNARQVGISTDAYQELEFALGQAGVSQQRLETMLPRFSRRLGEARDGGGAAADTIERLGLSMETASGEVRDTEDVLDDALVALAGIEDQSERSAAAGDLFGNRAGPELAAALDDGIEGIDEARQQAHDLGIVMDEEATAKAEEFGDKWDNVKQQVMGFIRGGGTPVMEWMTDSFFPFVNDNVLPLLSDLGEWLGPKLSDAADTLGQAFDNWVIPALRSFSGWWSDNGEDIIASAIATKDAIVGMAEDAGRWVDEHLMPPIEAFDDLVGAVLGDGGDVRARVQGFVDWFEDFWSAHGDTITRIAEGTWGDIVEMIEGFLDDLTTAINLTAGILTGDWDDFLDDMADRSDLFHSDNLDEWEAFLENVELAVGVGLDLITGDFQRAYARMTGDLDEHTDDSEGIWSKHGDSIADVVKSTGAILIGEWDYAQTTMVEDLLGFDRTATEIWDDFWRGVRTTAGEWLSDIGWAVTGWLDDVVGWFADLPGRVGDALSGLGSTIANAFRAPVNWVVDNVLNDFLSGVESLAEAIPGVSLDLPRVSTIPRFHSGGIAGVDGERGGGPLRHGEIAAILQQGEEVLTEDDPRHVGHQGATVSPGEVGGVMDSIRDLAGDALSSLRSTIADSVRPVIEAAISTAREAAGRFGPLGELTGGLGEHIGSEILDWIAGVDSEAEGASQAPGAPGGQMLGGSGTITQRLVQAFRAHGPPGRFTSGYRPGDPGLHGQARAADFAGPVPSPVPTPAMDAIFDFFWNRYGSGLRELIYAGRDPNILRGRTIPLAAMPPGLVRSHMNHVHAGMDEGGVLQPGWNLAFNGTGMPEPLARTDELGPKLDRVIAAIEGIEAGRTEIHVEQSQPTDRDTAQAVKLALRS